MNDKDIDSNQDPFCFKELENLRWQMTKLQLSHSHRISRMKSCVGVDGNLVIAIVIVIVLGVNGHLDIFDNIRFIFLPMIFLISFFPKEKAFFFGQFAPD